MASMDIFPMPMDMTAAVQGLVNLFLNMDAKSREMFIKLLVVKMEEEEVDLILQGVDMRNLTNVNNLRIKNDDIKKELEITDSKSDIDIEIDETEYFGHSLFSMKDEMSIDNDSPKQHVERKLKCSYCDESFFNNSDLKKHKATHQEYKDDMIKPFLCDECSHRSSCQSHLKRHKLVCHSGDLLKTFICEICSKAFATNERLKIHISREHTKNKIFNCDQCSYETAHQTSMKDHKMTHTGECPFVCHICSKSFKTKKNMNRHINGVHLGEKCFSCDQCNYKTAHISSMKDHKTTHTGERLFVCHICSKTFKTMKDMKRHVRGVHLGEKVNKPQKRIITGEKNHLCDLCPMGFTTQWSLKNHKESIHEGIKYYCDQCEYKATEKGNLARHVASIHEGIEFGCEECAFKAPSKLTLKNHVEFVHLGITHECNQCDHKATTKGNLTQHVAVVHQGKKYDCNECEYKATTKQHLRIHEESVHLGIRHQCSQCDHKAMTKGNLTLHVEAVHEYIQQDCKECDFTTFKKRAFLKHMTEHRKAQQLQNQTDYSTSSHLETSVHRLESNLNV